LHSLTEARIFALGGVGYPGITSEEEIQLKAIMALPLAEAEQKLESVYLSGNPQAMSYALMGMRKLDRKRYAELLTSARASRKTVVTMNGCIVSEEKLSEIAADLDSGKYDPWLR
jgi:hypothetical protein